MSILAKIFVTIPIIFCTLIGLIALVSPDTIGTILGVSADNAGGRGTISGDFAALFLTGAGAGALALLKGKPKLLWVPISLLGITMIGRIINIISTQYEESALPPIIIEAILVALLYSAMRMLSKGANA